MNFTPDLGKSQNWQLGFQTPVSPVMEGIINFHHDLFFFLVVILIFVMYLLARCLVLFNDNVNKTPLIVVHAPTLEIIWTVIPALILIVIAIPSFSLLYSIDELVQPVLTVKVVGHQWYWSYEFIDPKLIINEYFKRDLALDDCAFSFDSYMLADDDLEDKTLRLLEVDNPLYLPVEVNIRLLITSSDVLHSWAVPTLGVKLDACPGRLNQTSVYIKRIGHFYGQCSEICGVNHGFMPISVIGVLLTGDGSHLSTQTASALMPIFLSILKNKYC